MSTLLTDHERARLCICGLHGYPGTSTVAGAAACEQMLFVADAIVAARVAAERDRLLGKVEALAAEWQCSDDTCDGGCTGCAYSADLRALVAEERAT